jgi:hypothetical protein
VALADLPWKSASARVASSGLLFVWRHTSGIHHFLDGNHVLHLAYAAFQRVFVKTYYILVPLGMPLYAIFTVLNLRISLVCRTSPTG